MATYTAIWQSEQRDYASGDGKTLYSGPSHAAAKKAAAEALGYRRIESAYSYKAESKHGEDGVFFCRRRDADNEDYDAVCIVKS
jgi:diketogulonate reductase-like aldo/keto reductase